MTNTSLNTTAAILFALSAAAPALADTPTVEIGGLTCDLEERTNALIVSDQRFGCRYAPFDGAAETDLEITIRRIGVDAKIADETRLAWVVLAASADAEADALSGDYLGVSAEAAATGGAGARRLTDGSSQGFSLQPVSLNVERGFGAAAGVGHADLRRRDVHKN